MPTVQTNPHPVSTAQLAGGLVYVFAWPALLFVLAGDVRWVEGWLFSAFYVGLCTTVLAWLYRKDPALLSERFRRPGSGGQSAPDRAWVYAIGIAFMAWIALMPLDARRFHWSPPFSAWVEAAGAVLLLCAATFLFRAYRDNTFLSPLVRIQSERGQRVVTSGVYGVVRHPMYLGATLMFFGGPLLTGSLAGLALAPAMTVLLIGRIRGEEKLLTTELEGYADYRRKVRYRLVPFVW